MPIVPPFGEERPQVENVTSTQPVGDPDTGMEEAKAALARRQEAGKLREWQAAVKLTTLWQTTPQAVRHLRAMSLHDRNLHLLALELTGDKTATGVIAMFPPIGPSTRLRYAEVAGEPAPPIPAAAPPAKKPAPRKPAAKKVSAQHGSPQVQPA